MALRSLVLSRGPGVLAVVTAIVVGVIASIHPGVPTEDVSLHDGGVWVTNDSLRLVAHLNYPSRTLDGGLRSPSDSFDVSQAAKDVLVHDTTAGSVYPVDVSLITLGSPVKAEGLTVVQGGTKAAVVDAAAGKVWASDVTSVSGISPDASTPVIDGVAGATVVVGVDGAVHAVSRTGLLVTVTPQGDAWSKPIKRQLSGITDASKLSITSVGSEAVVLDRSTSTVYLASGQHSLSGLEEAQLQQPSASTSVVSLETPTALVKVALRNGEVAQVPSGVGGHGTPVAPVVMTGCRYAAWAVTGQYVRDCDDPSANVTRSVDKLQTAKNLTFRTNRDVVVINDMANGDVFVVSNQVVVVNNWDDILADLKSKEQKDNKNQQTTQEEANPDRTQQNHPPVAVDDQFGVRPGRSTTLPVLQNDTDSDGDVLTATPGKSPSIGTVRAVRAGAALQITVPENATGGGSFTYTADDGRGGTADANVSVSVHPWNVNSAPVQWRATRAASVVSGGQVAYNVAPDWSDPDGDQFFISSVAFPTGMTAKFRADGLVTVRDLGVNQPGRYDVKVVMSDGSKETEGVLHVDVRAKGNYAPVANADFARVIKGEEIVVKPLANDTDPSGSTLRLAKISDGPAGTTVSPSYDTGTFRFTSTVVGTFYLDYVVSNGPSASKGVVRVDVVDPVTDAPPVADDDLALLPAGGQVVVDVLANDFDPTGGVLVVQSTDISKVPALHVEVVGRAKVRVTAPGGLTTQASFSYTISNGFGSATATVTVIPLPAVASGLPPVASDDVATVRAGDIVTVHVLDNDTSPAGLALSVDPTLQLEGVASAGEAFVSENTVRFKAGSEPGTARIVYTVRDTQKGYASAQVKIDVRAADSGNNAPVAPPLTARVLSGASVNIPVSLDGIDPDGDSVTLLGVDTAPSKGTVTTASEYMTYEAPSGSSGTDTFTYAVMDRFGARSIGTVKVGIAPPSPINQAPVAVADLTVARPGRLLSIAVLANDIDPDGDPLSLVPGSAKGQGNAASIQAATDGPRVTVTAPQTPGLYSFVYQVSDGRGGVTQGQLTLDIRADTPLQAPIARDDVVQGYEVAGKSQVDVDVLANDEDPDGAAEALKVSVDATSAASVKGKGIVTVTLAPARQVIVYTVTDVDGLTAKAVIVVPGTQDRLPVLKPDKIPVTIKGGDTLTVNLADYVSVRDGHSPILTFENRVKAGPGGNGDPIVKNATTMVFTTVGEYVGNTSLTFEVTDGSSPDDPNGIKAVLTLPIVVQSSGKTRPKVSPSEIDISSIEPAKEVDLLPMVTDPDQGDMAKMSFSLGKVPPGFNVTLSGHTLKASAPVETKIGTAGLVEITVTDGSTTPVTAQIPIKTIASSRPLITTTEAVITTANAGKAETVDLSQYSTNPFADLNKPLTMVGQPQVVVGTGNATANGLNVTVAPSAGFHGQLTVVYTLADATGETSRQVQGKITLTVRDKPDAPTAVTAVTNASRSATVSWQPGANNGAQISTFTVKWNGGTKDCGATTVCELANMLTNNVEYTFTVTATNEVGESVPSAASAIVRPDVKPNQPAPPTLTFGDKQIDVAWVAPTTEGSPVESYTLEIDGPTGGVTQQQVVGTSYTWTGLTNGTSYRFRVQAHSKAVLPSDWSSYSATEIPAGIPLSLVAPTVAKQPVSALAPSATVTWAPPNGNGDNAMTYELRRTGGATVYTGAAPTTQLTLSVDTADQTFEYRAKNKAGWSAWSPASAPIRAFQTPGVVTGLVAEATGTNNQVKVTFAPAPGNGALASEITYVWNAAGGSGTVASGGTITYTGLVNGNNFQISISARSTVRGESVTGPSTASNVVVPFGTPFQAGGSASGSAGGVTLSWDTRSSGNGRPIANTEISIDGGAWQTVSPSAVLGSQLVNANPSEVHSIRVRASYGPDGNGLVGAEGYFAAAANPMIVSGYLNGTVTCPSGVAGTCYGYKLVASGARPGHQVQCTITDVNGNNVSTKNSGTAADANGNVTWYPSGWWIAGSYWNTIATAPAPNGSINWTGCTVV